MLGGINGADSMKKSTIKDYQQVVCDMQAISRLLDQLTGDDERDAWIIESAAYIAARYKPNKP